MKENKNKLWSIKGLFKSNMTKFYINNRAFIFVMLFLPLLFFIVVEIIHRGGISEGIVWIINNPIESLFNYAIAFSLINILLVITGTKAFFILAGLLFLILAALAQISFSKIDLRGEPLTILDFRLLREAANIAGVLDFRYFLPIITVTVVLLICSAIILPFVKMKISKPFRLVVTVVCLGILFFGYESDINTLAKMKVNIPADVSWNHNENGFMLATLVDSKFLKIPEPEDYSKETIEEVYKRMLKKTQGYAKRGPKEKPNVIFFMSEAFWDVKEGLNLPLNKDPIPNYRSIAGNTLSGFIEVPGIGGGTANTEYEVLTGLSKRFLKDFSTPYNPYNSYIHGPIQSLARIFGEMDYQTTAIHTYHSWFYRRNEVYKHLGFDRFISLEGLLEEPKMEGAFAHDSEVNRLIIDEIKKTPERDFIHVVTMQGHGPYTDLKIPDRGIEINMRLSDTSTKTIKNYLNLMGSVDESLLGLVTHFKEFPEPTVIVFYGDHIPALGNEVYKELGFNIYEAKGRKTNMFMWSNYANFSGEVDLDANMLGAFVLNKIGLADDLYMNYLYKFFEQAPHTIDNQNSEMYHDLELLQYDIMHGKQYFYEFTEKPEVKKEFAIGYPMKLERAQATEFKNGYIIEVVGEGIPWMSAVYLNENKISTEWLNDKTAFITLTKDQVLKQNVFDLKVKVIDSREKVVKESNVLSYKSIKDIPKNKSKETIWNRLKLDGSLEWELFSQNQDYTVVRIDLKLEEGPYFVEKNGLLLMDKNADKIDDKDFSDVYENGYLYISIDNKESGWSGKATTHQIKEYFDKREYYLNRAN